MKPPTPPHRAQFSMKPYGFAFSGKKKTLIQYLRSSSGKVRQGGLMMKLRRLRERLKRAD